MTLDVRALAMPPLKRRLVGLGFGVASDLSMIALLILSMWLIMRSGEQPPILHLTFAIVGVRALAIGRAVFRYLERLISHNRALTQLAKLRGAVFERLIPLVPGGLKSRTTGDVHASLIDDIDQLQDAPLRVWQPLSVSALTVLAGVGIVGFMSPIAGVVNLVLCMLAVLATWGLVTRHQVGRRARVAELRAMLVAALIDRFEAATVLHVFGVTGDADARVAEISAQLTREQRAQAGLTGLIAAIMLVTGGAAALLTLWLVAPEAGFTSLSAPVFAALIVAPAAIFEVLVQVPQALQARQLVRESAARLEGLLGTELPAEIPRGAAAGTATDDPPVSADAGDEGAPLLELREVTAAYPGAQKLVLTGVTATLGAGELMVVTGESGAGKSTLAQVLVRFLEYGGSYRLQGRQARDFELEHVRATVGLCEQSPHLFDADLRQNLKFARPGASDGELYEVLDRVGLQEWAESRGGLDMRVGEHGALVSGGQAGRIALARVLLADFPVVVLDEPTAGVDAENADAMLRDMLAAIPHDRAVIVITHTGLPKGITPSVQLQL